MRRLIREFVVFWLVGFLFLGVAEAQTPECKIGRLYVKATRLPANCDVAGTLLLRAFFFTAGGEPINTSACGIDGVTWGTGHETWKVTLDPQNFFRAWVKNLYPGDEVPLYAAVTQGDESYIWERTFLYE